MSQEKVDRYKEQKANRKEIIEKEKRRKKLGRVGMWAALVVVVAGLAASIGISARNSHQRYLDSLPDYNRTSVVISDYTGVTATEADTVEQ